MAYSHGQFSLMIGIPGTPIATQGLGIKGASTCIPFFRPVQIEAVVATITTAITVTAAILTLKYRPTPGSAAGEISLGTITLPVAGSAIGQQYFKRISPFEANPGGEIVLDLTQVSTAGAALFGVQCSPTTEFPANIPLMIASV